MYPCLVCDTASLLDWISRHEQMILTYFWAFSCGCYLVLWGCTEDSSECLAINIKQWNSRALLNKRNHLFLTHRGHHHVWIMRKIKCTIFEGGRRHFQETNNTNYRLHWKNSIRFDKVSNGIGSIRYSRSQFRFFYRCHAIFHGEMSSMRAKISLNQWHSEYSKFYLMFTLRNYWKWLDLHN